MICKCCGSKMNHGKVACPVYDQGQASIYPVGKIYYNCMKCPLCGYSELLGQVYHQQTHSVI